ncbi:hypothetical protein [Rhodococcus gannanensis]|uniref:WXG100 family type VII secretion target n=1 Tax=Rhodococcus gannanensis TaxID=1960308 RepID=A0ABW4P4C2_9NOCA
MDTSNLAGFAIDMQEVGSVFSSNSTRLLSALSLRGGGSGLLADLVPHVQALHDALAGAHTNDLSGLDSLRANIGTVADDYQESGDAHARSIAAAGVALNGHGGSTPAAPREVSRFNGLQLPILQDQLEESYTVRQVVTAGIEMLDPYEEALGQAIGVRPVSDYLSPLDADWEQLQSVGRGIGLLGINDYVAATNLANGTRWLQNSWSGDASIAFGTASSGLGDPISGRSEDLDAVAKVVENGGRLLERLVYNQAIELAGAVAKPMNFLRFTLPLGVWAQLIDSPMQSSIRNEIASAVDELTASAESRHGRIVSTVDTIAGALKYEQGKSLPVYDPSWFELPDKVTIDAGARRYGFGSNVWWEHAVDSIS